MDVNFNPVIANRVSICDAHINHASLARDIFKTLSAEDLEFSKDGDSDFEIPEFGDSQSAFEEVRANANGPAHKNPCSAFS